jgi:hypothetical protein
MTSKISSQIQFPALGMGRTGRSDFCKCFSRSGFASDWVMPLLGVGFTTFVNRADYFHNLMKATMKFHMARVINISS